jgi:hypothetical protein
LCSDWVVFTRDTLPSAAGAATAEEPAETPVAISEPAGDDAGEEE